MGLMAGLEMKWLPLLGYQQKTILWYILRRVRNNYRFNDKADMDLKDLNHCRKCIYICAKYKTSVLMCFQVVAKPVQIRSMHHLRYHTYSTKSESWKVKLIPLPNLHNNNRWTCAHNGLTHLALTQYRVNRIQGMHIYVFPEL